jgi:release factor glutamine methyltransferase
VRALRDAGCVFAEDEARVITSTGRSDAERLGMLARRVRGEPIEHVVGWAEFAGLRVAVDPGVFVPRRRTEFLAARAAAFASRRTRPVVLDLCCGAGAIGLSVATAHRQVELHAVDIDPRATECARRNIGMVGGRLHEGDLYAALPVSLRGRIDVIVANVPYVPTGELGFMPAEARLHEPAVALDGGADGLDVVRRVAADAGSWLVPGGHLLVETSERQGRQMVGVLRRAGLDASSVRDEELDATVVIGAASPAATTPA